MTSSVGSKVVDPYAEALMSLAQEHNVTEEIGEDIRSLLGILRESPELASFMSSPIVKADDKKAVLRRIAGDRLNHFLLNFLLLLVDRRRIMFIDAIGEKYLELLRKLNNIVLAIVTSAAPMNEGQHHAVLDKIKELTGARGVEMQTSVDPDLIGGVVFRVGSQVFDASLRGQLRRISLSLMSAG